MRQSASYPSVCSPPAYNVLPPDVSRFQAGEKDTSLACPRPNSSCSPETLIILAEVSHPGILAGLLGIGGGAAPSCRSLCGLRHTGR